MLRGPDQIEADLAEMQQAAETEPESLSWALLGSAAVRRELQVGMCLQTWKIPALYCTWLQL